MMYNLSILEKDRCADFKAKDPTFIDSVFEENFNKWLEKTYKVQLLEQKPKLKRRIK